MNQQHTFTINDHRLVALEYNQHLDTPPLIFIHGIFNSVHLWEQVQIQAIRKDFHWFSVSLPGHYPARLPENFKTNQLTPSLVGELLAEVISELTGGIPTWLIGYSTGAYAGLCIAHHAPHLIERLLLLEGFADGVWGKGLRISQLGGQLSGLANAILHPYGMLNTPGKMLTRFGYNVIGSDLNRMENHPNMADVVGSNWETVRDGKLRDIYPYFRYLFHCDISHWLPEMRIPTLILHGDEDHT
ncbi:MAG: alpha/beta hydrolase, partial [Chloroflexota bacterium]